MIDNSDNEDDDDTLDDDDDPILEYRSFAHDGGVNRIRRMPHPEVHITATWSETGKVHIWDITDTVASLDTPGKLAPSNMKPLITVTKHKTEGFAMDWSSLTAGRYFGCGCRGEACFYFDPHFRGKTPHRRLSQGHLLDRATPRKWLGHRCARIPGSHGLRGGFAMVAHARKCLRLLLRRPNHQSVGHAHEEEVWSEREGAHHRCECHFMEPVMATKEFPLLICFSF